MAMFGDWLKSELNKKNMPQSRLAEIIGVTPTHVNHIVHNRRKPSNDLIRAISSALRISEEKVFREADVLNPVSTRDEQIEEITYIFNNLSQAGKESAIRYFRFLLDDKEASAKDGKK